MAFILCRYWVVRFYVCVLWDILLLLFPHVVLQLFKTSGVGPVDSCQGDAEQLAVWKLSSDNSLLFSCPN